MSKCREAGRLRLATAAGFEQPALLATAETDQAAPWPSDFTHALSSQRRSRTNKDLSRPGSGAE